MLGGSLVDAQVHYSVSKYSAVFNSFSFQLFAEADMFVGVSISGSVNQAVSPFILQFMMPID